MRIQIYTAGTSVAPRTASSAVVIRLLQTCGVEAEVIDISSDSSLRDRVGRASQFDLFPQLFVDGEFIGGGEVAVELLKRGELRQAVPQ